ncbi:hypothetical protein CSC12_4612 [Klebsiella michiganensis]|nr:hypothetical protein CSC12_4612 [Klebsiella michiganensis]
MLSFYREEAGFNSFSNPRRSMSDQPEDKIQGMDNWCP